MSASDPAGLDYREQAHALIRAGYWAGHGPQGVAFIEDAIRMAEEHQDDELGYQARLALAEVAILTSTEKSLVAFAWCLAQADAEPDRRDWPRLLALYKIILGNIWDFPSISQDRIESAFEDFLKRSLAAGASPRARHKMHCWMKLDEGDLETAKRDFEMWGRSPADWLSDCCDSCEGAFQARYHLLQGDEDSAIDLARKVVNRSRGCESFRVQTRSNFLEALVKRGRLAEADQWHARGYASLRRGQGMLNWLAKHLIYLTMTDQRTKAISLFQRHFPEAWESSVPFPKYQFYLASLFAWEWLKETGRPLRKLRLPDDFPLHRDDGACRTADLAAWLRLETERMADQFDRRSQSALPPSPTTSIPAFNYRRREMEQVLSLKGTIAPLPRSTPPPPSSTAPANPNPNPSEPPRPL